MDFYLITAIFDYTYLLMTYFVFIENWQTFELKIYKEQYFLLNHTI